MRGGEANIRKALERLLPQRLQPTRLRAAPGLRLIEYPQVLFRSLSCSNHSSLFLDFYNPELALFASRSEIPNPRSCGEGSLCSSKLSNYCSDFLSPKIFRDYSD